MPLFSWCRAFQEGLRLVAALTAAHLPGSADWVLLIAASAVLPGLAYVFVLRHHLWMSHPRCTSPWRVHCNGPCAKRGLRREEFALYTDWVGEKGTQCKASCLGEAPLLCRENSRRSGAQRKPCICPEPRSACVRKRNTERGRRCRRQTSFIL